MPLILKGDDGLESRVHVQLKYIPIQMQLDPSESINNMGTLRVDILNAIDLPAADSNGSSDPYCKFLLNEKQIHKTEVQRKTLNPAWNEFFEVSITSRIASKMKLECWDWDRSDRDDYLGSAVVDLQVLEPFAPKEVVLGLDGKSGTVRLKMLFKPDYVTRSRQGTSTFHGTFHGTFATSGQVTGAPVKSVGKGVTLIGGNVIRGASFVGRGFRRKKEGSGEEEIEAGTPPISSGTVEGPYQLAAAPASLSSSTSRPYTPRVISETQRPSTQSDIRQLSYNQDTPSTVISNGASYGAAPGTAKISLVSAVGFEGSNIRVFVRQNTAKGLKEVHKSRAMKISKGSEGIWDEHIETFRVGCLSDTQFAIQVKDTHTFGADIDLGDGTFSIVDATLGLGAASGFGSKKIVGCGSGSVTVKTSFTHADQGAPQTTTSVGGHLRKSLMPGRNSSPKERSVSSGPPVPPPKPTKMMLSNDGRE